MTTPPALEAQALLGTFVPCRLAALLCSSGRPRAGEPLALNCVVLLADLSNFTTAADRLQSRYGADGAGRLSQLLNQCFAPIIDAIHAHGGEVASIRGDSLLALWYLPDAAPADLAAQAAQSSLHCASQMQREFAQCEEAAAELLALHIGLSSGPLLACATGGLDDRFEIVCGSDAMVQACLALNQAGSGSTVASPAWWASRPAGVLGAPTIDGYMALIVSTQPSLVTPMPTARQVLSPADAAHCAWFVPDAVTRLDLADPSALSAQMRVVTTVFCRAHDLEVRDSAGFAHLQALVLGVQRVLQSRSGRLDKVNVDEQGVFIVALFGLPNRHDAAHATDAVDAAVEIEALLVSHAHRCAIGISTGRTYCGVVGSAAQQHYTCHGTVPNLGARYMAFIERGIACDDATVEAANASFEFTRQRPAPLKGLPSTSRFNRFRARRASLPVDAPPHGFVGRRAELQALGAMALAVLEGAGVCSIGLVGAAGIGKSAVAIEALQRAVDLGFQALVLRGRRAAPLAPMAAWQQATALAPVDATHPGRRAIFVLLDDEAWIDEASRARALAEAQSAGSALVVATRRDHDHDSSLAPARQQLRLEGLEPADSARLLGVCVGRAHVPAAWVEWVHDNSQGHPRLVTGLAQALRGPLSAAEGEAQELPLDELPVPYEVEMVLTHVIDELAPAARVALHLAAVVQGPFTPDDLLAISPWPASRAWLSDGIAALSQCGVLVPVAASAQARTLQRPLLARVATGLLGEAPRRAIHGRLAARRAEGLATGELDAQNLAFHWEQAGDVPRALASLRMAAADSMAAGFYKSAAASLEAMLRLTEGPANAALPERAAWLAQLGRCRVSLGRLPEGETSARQSLALQARPLPLTNPRWLALLGRETLRQLTLRLGRRRGTTAHNATDAVDASAEAVNVFAVASYFSAQPLPLLTSNLMAVNIAESAGRLEAAARPAAVVGYMLGLFRLHAAARGFFERAREACIAAGDTVGHHSTLGGQAMYELGFGRWVEARSSIAQALALCRQVGEQHDIELALTLSGLAEHYVGDFATSLQVFSHLYDSARSRANEQHMAWGAYAMAQSLIPLGRAREAILHLQEASELLLTVEDRHSDLICSGVLSLAHLHSGDYVRARESALLAGSLAAQTAPSNFGSYVGYYSPAVTLVSLWGRALRFAPADAPALEQATVAAVSHLAQYAKLFPVAMPRLLLLRGWVRLRQGRPAAARALWKRCLARAAQMQMPYEEALAHWSLQPLAQNRDDFERHAGQSARLFAANGSMPLFMELGRSAHWNESLTKEENT